MGEKDGKSEGGEKKVEEKGPIQVVLKVDMHCDGCAKKIKKSVKGFAGVETVEADSASNKLTVKGKVDPVKLLERVESKTKKKVQLISPQPPKKDEKKEDEKKGDDKKPDQKKPEEKKPEEKKKETTVVYKTRLHCEGCIQKIRRLVKKHKGVQTVAIDGAKDLITVTGTMDPKDLQASLKEKFNRPVDIVPPKKEDGKGGGGGGDKKEGGGGDKKEGGGGDKGKGGEKKEGGGDKKEGGGAPKVEGMKMDHYGYPTYPIYEHGFPSHIPPPPPPPEYANGYGQGYAVQYVHAPQIFSDENPNACSVM